MTRTTLLIVFCCVTTQVLAAPALQDYVKPGQLEPVPAGVVRLDRTPWRSNPRTVAAYDALQGIGVYYKHLAPNDNVMKQLAAVGVKRLRLAPHHAMYIHPDWTGPSAQEQTTLRGELNGCRAAGIRPCVTFVHLPAQGTGTAMQQWATRSWNKGFMPLGDGPDSPEAKAYLEKVWLALKFILDAAREAGFTKPGSYDLEMGCNLWWGAPALPPFPGLNPEMLQPGRQVYEFEKALVERLRAAGYREPVLWNGMAYHQFEAMTDAENFPGTIGRAISFYSPMTQPSAWPPATALTGVPAGLTLYKPEGWMADYSRHDNLIALLQSSQMPVAITSLGVVPGDIPGAQDGWLLKSKGLTRSLAFWLNQGAAFVLLHSAYEGAQDKMSHALIPDFGKAPDQFRWQQSQPLRTLKEFTAALEGARRLSRPTVLRFRYALADDMELIPGELKASDAVAILPFQVDSRTFALAVYIVTPNIAAAYPGTMLTLEIDRAIAGQEVLVSRPVTQTAGKAEILKRARDATTLRLPVTDDVTWVRLRVR